MRRGTLSTALALGALAAALMHAEIGGGVKDPQVTLSKWPPKTLAAAKADSNGIVELNVPEAGEYQVSIAKQCPPNCPPTGPVRPRPVRQATMMVVSEGANGAAILTQGISRFPTGADTGLLSDNIRFTVEQPGRLILKLEDLAQPIAPEIASFHLTTGVTPRPKPLHILGAGMETFTYQLSFEPDDRGTWSMTFTPSNGRKAATGATPIAEARVAASRLAPGIYTGRIRIRISGEREVDEFIPATLTVSADRPPFDLDIEHGVLVVPAAGAAATPLRIAITNTSGATRTYQLRSRGRRLPVPPVLSLASGQSGTWTINPVTAGVGAITDAYDVVHCPPGPTPGCANPVVEPSALKVTTIRPRAPLQRGAACSPAMLVPVIRKRPARLQRGITAQFDVDVWDDCGTRPEPAYTLDTGKAFGNTKNAARAQTAAGIVLVTPGASGADTLRLEYRSPKGIAGIVEEPLIIEESTVPRIDGIEGFGTAVGSQIVVYGQFPTRESLVAPEGRNVFELGGVRLALDGEPLALAAVTSTRIVSKPVAGPPRAAFLMVETGAQSSEALPIEITSAQPVIIGPIKKALRKQPVTESNPVQPGEEVLIEAQRVGADTRQVRVFAGKTAAEVKSVNKVCCRTGSPGEEYYEITAVAPRAIPRRAWTVVVQEASSGGVTTLSEGAEPDPVTIDTWADAVPAPYDINGQQFDGTFQTFSLPAADYVFPAGAQIFPVTAGVMRMGLGFELFGLQGPLGEGSPAKDVSWVAHHTVTAYKLDIELTGSPNCGTVSPSGSSALAPDHYLEGTTVQLDVVTDPACTFSGFTGGNGQLSGNTVTMTAPTTVQAVFQQPVPEKCYFLYTQAAPAAGGVFSTSPAPNGTSQQGCYIEGTSVTVTAAPSAGYEFRGLSGDVTSSTPTATIAMNAYAFVEAAFCRQTNFTILGLVGLSVKVNGQVQTLPFVFQACPGTAFTVEADAVYPSNSTLRFRFEHWLDPALKTNRLLSITMPNSDTSITMVTRQQTPALITINPANGGDVLVAGPSADSCQQTSAGNPRQWWCTDDFPIRIEAVPASGFSFSNYSGGLSGNSAVRTFSLFLPSNIIANFTPGATTSSTVTATYGSRTGGNVVLNYANSAAAAATNLRITAIGSTSPAAIVWDQGTLTLPIALGNLAASASGTRSLTFRATSGSVNVAFSFVVTLAADNMTARPFTIQVPAVPIGTATVDITNPTRVNNTGSIALSFTVRNTGTGGATGAQAFVAITGPSINLAIPNPQVILGTIAGGTTAPVAVSVTGAPGANLSTSTFNVQVIVAFTRPDGSEGRVTRTWSSSGTSFTQLN